MYPNSFLGKDILPCQGLRGKNKEINVERQRRREEHERESIADAVKKKDRENSDVPGFKGMEGK